LKKLSPRERSSVRNWSPDSGAINNAIVEPTIPPTTIPIKKPSVLLMIFSSFLSPQAHAL
jgi:hypothetical protein